MPVLNVRSGRPCTCAPGRVVRFAVPRAPGIPDGEVSCRPEDSVEWASVRHHPLPAGASVEVRVPGLTRETHVPEPDPEDVAHDQDSDN